MLSTFRSVSYVPVLKWKTGERRALSTLREPLRDQLVPFFLLPPSGEYDHETRRRLTALGHIKLFGDRLHKAWGRRVAFVDTVNVDETPRQDAVDPSPTGLFGLGREGHPLAEVLGRAHAAHATACPATALDRSPEYQEVVRRFVARHPDLPICIRIDPLGEMERDSFAADLLALLDRLGCGPERVVLMLDFVEMNAPKPDDVASFAEILAERIYRLPALSKWLKVVTTLTSFPKSLKGMKPGDTKIVSRTDWMIYRTLIQREPDFVRSVAFGDRAVDPTPFPPPAKAMSPSAHLRYTTPTNYIVIKGQQAVAPVGYAAIFPVAEALAARPDFMGSLFSEGDGYINRLADRKVRTSSGSAPTWRWASTDHHLTLVVQDLRVLGGLDHKSDKVPQAETVQGVLL